jgi:hypothetical protein
MSVSGDVIFFTQLVCNFRAAFTEGKEEGGLLIQNQWSEKCIV